MSCCTLLALDSHLSPHAESHRRQVPNGLSWSSSRTASRTSCPIKKSSISCEGLQTPHAQRQKLSTLPRK